ncbi:MAG: efflux RND transporter permease subunit, partial [Planctomycetota bacterium]
VRSISNVGSSAIYGGALAIVVLLLFLRNFRSTIVIATAIPVSIIATFALLYFAHSTLNIMTLGGLALGIGMLVDNSIVVLENIFRMRESGETLERAAVDGAEEVAAAVMASTLTTVVVFLPLIFVRGMSVVMFKQLSIVVGFSLLCSLVVALTLVPMLSARILPAAPVDEKSKHTFHRRVFEVSGRYLKSMENGYRKLLHFALANRAFVVVAAVLLLTASLLVAPYIGTELMPATDEGVVRAEVEMAVGTRLSLLDEKFKVIEKIVNESVPEIRCTVTNVGGSRWYGSAGHTGDLRISLKPQSQRTRSSEQIAADLRGKLSNIPGMVVRTRADQGLIVFRLTTQGADKVQVEVRGHDLQMA